MIMYIMMFKKWKLSGDYLKIFILEHYSRDMVRVVIENDGSMVEGRWRNNGGDGMWWPTDMKSWVWNLMMNMLLMLLLLMMMNYMLCSLSFMHFFTWTWCLHYFPCCWSLSHSNLHFPPSYSTVNYIRMLYNAQEYTTHIIILKVYQSKRKRRTCQPHVSFSWYVNIDILAVTLLHFCYLQR